MSCNQKEVTALRGGGGGGVQLAHSQVCKYVLMFSSQRTCQTRVTFWQGGKKHHKHVVEELLDTRMPVFCPVGQH